MSPASSSSVLWATGRILGKSGVSPKNWIYVEIGTRQHFRSWREPAGTLEPRNTRLAIAEKLLPFPGHPYGREAAAYVQASG